MRTVTIVGTSLAGLRAAQELRAQGFDGELVLVGDEPHRPYDRPPLSKDFLLGKIGVEDLELADAAGLLELGARWHLGKRAVRLSSSDGSVVLSDGTELASDGVVIATGASARTLGGGLAGVHTLRTLDDAVALRREVADGGVRVVVIGAGFIGAETASTCRALGCDVTVVEAAPVPLSRVLGAEFGAACAGLHEENGVRLVTGTGVFALEGDTRVTGVRLADGTVLDADVVVAGIGVRPNTEWLDGSGLLVDNGVVCDEGCVTASPNVVAAGDVARFRHDGAHVRTEHWTSAAEQPGVAVRNLLAGSTVAHHANRGYFWSEQYGHRIQFAGRAAGEAEVVEGSLAGRRFVATYLCDGVVTGVLAMDSPKPFTRLRRGLARAATVPAG
ncbi:NAD(P)/FAD-dependent oxidoreductase [Amycolatopsis minnesotensis]|uniref:FAD-dependent oxidoreductase n=1 Tax=Amycolatopsis minnesotensis TaxID=337894 RepID=A0ABN2R661_9PSEU